MKFKRILSIIFAMLLIISSLPICVFASEPIDANSLDEIANGTIEIQMDDNVILYKNIDCFVETVKETFPEINDIDIAKFILDYSKKDYSNFSDDMILEAISYKEIYVSEEYIKVTDYGEVEYLSKEEAEKAIRLEKINENLSRASWTSPNGYMKITTTASHNKTSGNKKYYIIDSKATWLQMPVCFFKDVFVLNHTGTYDDSYTGTGYLSETLNCCTSSKNYKDTATTAKNGSNVVFEYPNTNVAAIRFGLVSSSGYTCNRITSGSHSRAVSGIESYIKYRIIVNSGSSANVQGAYCHKQVSVGSIGIGITSGSVSFSLAGSKKEYKASPITIKA